MIAFSPHVAQFWARLPPSTQYLQVSFMFEISPRRINHGTHHLARGAEHSGVSGIRKQTFREPYEYVGWQFTQGMLTFHHPSFVSNFHQLTALAKVTRRRKFVFYSSTTPFFSYRGVFSVAVLNDGIFTSIIVPIGKFTSCVHSRLLCLRCVTVDLRERSLSALVDL